MCEAGMPIVKKHWVWDDVNRQYLVLSEETYKKLKEKLDEKRTPAY